MAGSTATAERIQWAVDRLLECRSTSATLAAVASDWEIRRRQARRLMDRSHAVLVADLKEATKQAAFSHHGLGRSSSFSSELN